MKKTVLLLVCALVASVLVVSCAAPCSHVFSTKNLGIPATCTEEGSKTY